MILFWNFKISNFKKIKKNELVSIYIEKVPILFSDMF